VAIFAAKLADQNPLPRSTRINWSFWKNKVEKLLAPHTTAARPRRRRIKK
jgi:hypothetical protein